jgi:hypothetical protein
MEVLQEFIKPEPEYDDLKETSLYPFEIQRYFKARMKQIMKKNMKNINPINID